jgi:ribose/xylose/arabinose/galactoside ABC-type transport system permease subunit
VTRDRLAELLLRNMTLVIFLVVFIYFGLQAPNFLGPQSLANIVKQASFIGIIAVGMTFVLLTAGIDLSVGSNMYLSAMAAGYVMLNPTMQTEFGVAVALLAGLGAGLVFGAVNAFCIVVLKITPFLVTLATLVAGRGLGTAITESFGIEMPPVFKSFGSWSLLKAPQSTTGIAVLDYLLILGALLTSMPILVFAAVVAAAHFALAHTQFGRQVYAVGNDIEAARKAGINVDGVLFSVYVICGGAAAMGGVTLIALIGRLNQTFGVTREFDVITAAVLGGTSLFGGVGTAFGAVVGSTLVQAVQSGLVFTKINLYLQPMVLAGIIFLAVLIDALRAERLRRLRRRLLRAD